MFKKILIANRGEIAVRVIRACQELGIGTVAVFSKADRDSLHVKMADEAVCIGPEPVADSYLNIPNIISAACITNSEAIHPGYGLLAENANFADICENHHLKFIGPSSAVIEKLGDKVKARHIAALAKVNVVPGTSVIEDEKEALKFASDSGYPVIIKATAGGGGRGMRIIHNREDLLKGIAIASAEALTAFGDRRVYLEKYLNEPKHVEVQVLADEHNHVIHLGERDCSIQRRNQKILEEAPCFTLPNKIRASMVKSALRCIRAAGYVNAGTVEFLLEEEKNRFYFIEMNTRIQVEHPVTEMITNVDIVKEQIRIAAGLPLGYSQESIHLRGHCIECRVNAEDPQNNFLPSFGKVEYCHWPSGPGIRVDTHVYSGYSVPPFYDSLLAKILAWGSSREEAITRMKRALEETEITGVKTNIPVHQSILNNAFFKKGQIYVNFIDRRIKVL